MAHLLRDQKVFLQANRLLKLEYFEEPAESQYKLMWACAQQFWKDNNKLIPVEHLYAMLQDRMRGTPRFGLPETQEAVLQSAYRIFCVPETSLFSEVAFKQIEAFINVRGLAPKMAEAVERGSEGIREFMSSMKREVGTQVCSGAEAVTPFLTAPKLGVLPRIPTGVTFIDLMLNGGPRIGEVYGFLGESGGGKTTMSNQVAISYARSKHRVAVFTYEEPVSNEYLIPVYACASGVSRNALEALPADFDPSQLDADTSERLKKAMDVIGPYLAFYDMSGIYDKRGYGGVEEIASILAQARDNGNPYEAIVIDWFWVLMTRVFGRDRKSKIDDERKYAQDVCDQIKNLAREFNVWALVMQQMAPAAAGGKKKKSWREAAEMRSFAWYFHGCLVLEPLNEQKIGALHLSKGRNMSAASTMVKLDGEHATFVSLSKDMVHDKRQDRWIDKGKVNAVPDAAGRFTSPDKEKAIDVINAFKGG